MEYTVEDLLNKTFEDTAYPTAEVMLDDVELIVEDMVQDAYRWLRRFQAGPYHNAKDLGIEVEEYEF